MTRTKTFIFSVCMFFAYCNLAFADAVSLRAQPPITTLRWNEPVACLQLDRVHEPHCIHDLYALGMKHLQAQVFAHAIVRFDQILSMKAYSLVYGNRGIAHAALGDFKRARADFEKTVSMNPSLHETWFNLARLDIVQQRPRSALEHINRAIAVASDVAEYHETRAFLYRQLGQHTRAAAETRVAKMIQDRLAQKDDDHTRVADQPAH